MSQMPTVLGKANRLIEKGETFQIHIAANGDWLSEAIDFTELNEWRRVEREALIETWTKTLAQSS